MKQFIPALYVVGAILALAGAVLKVTAWQIYAPYIVTIGGTMVTLAIFNTPLAFKTKILKRLRIQQIFGGLTLILAGAFMLYTRGNEWIACLTISAILQLYTSFRIPQEEAKERENQ